MPITPFEASVWARRQRLGDIGAKIILMLLADYSDDRGTCFPGIDRIAEETEQSKSTVLRKLRLLAELGLVTIERRHGEGGFRTSNRYVMDLTLTVSRADVTLAKERLVERHDEEGAVQGVNLTPGSEVAPKCQIEPTYVSPGDTVTTRGTTSSTPYPHESEQEPAQERRLALVAASAPSAPVSGPQIAFSDWYALYPRKVGKAAAEKRWGQLTGRGKVDPQVLMAGLENWVAEWQRKGTEQDFIPHASTWLNQRRWEDELSTPAPVDPYANLLSPSAQREAWQ
jgi:DNA-binding transcriptional ArsR family regulator